MPYRATLPGTPYEPGNRGFRARRQAGIRPKFGREKRIVHSPRLGYCERVRSVHWEQSRNAWKAKRSSERRSTRRNGLAVASRASSRPGRGRRVRIRCALDRNLLPAVVSVEEAPPRASALLSATRCSRAEGFPRMPPMPPADCADRGTLESRRLRWFAGKLRHVYGPTPDWTFAVTRNSHSAPSASPQA